METNEPNSQETKEVAAPLINPLERSVDLAISLPDLDKEIAQRLAKLGKTARMPGFRPGKLPAKIVAQQYGDQARHEAIGDLLERVLSERVKADNIRMAGYPDIQPKQTDSKTELEFKVVYEVYPEITLGLLNGVEIVRSSLEVGEAEVTKTIDVLRKQRMRYNAVERAAANGDRVIVDFLGTKDGVPFAGGEAKNSPIMLGEGAMLPDFEKAIIGLKAGESKTFEMTFPDDYHAKEMAGQLVSFTITVNVVSESILPEVNTEFAKELGVLHGDVDKMRSEIESNLKREVKNRLQGLVKNQVMDALLKANPIDVPKSLVGREIDQMIKNARQEMMQRGGSAMKDFPMQREWFSEQATRRIRLGLVLSELVKVHKLEPTPAQIKAVVTDAAQSYERPEEIIRWYYAEPQRLAEIEGLTIEQNVVEWALKEIKIVEKAADFDELMAKNP